MKDPAFLFYPGDYLRDTQCLSEAAQVAYDRIMCEHMRNICLDMCKIIVSKNKVEFFTKRLNEEERGEVYHVLKEINGGFQISWVAESISKRKAYTESRSKNRKSKKDSENDKDMKTYDSHMVNESKDSISNNIFNFKNSLLEYGFKEELINDWLIVRKNKKSSNTETSFKSFISEIEKTNCDKNEILRIIVENSWSGFKAVWYEELLKRNSNGQEQSPQQSFINAANSDEARSFEFSKGNN